MSIIPLTITKVFSESIPVKTLMEKETHFTPVVISVLTIPHPVRGSDGFSHFVYELQLTNVTSFSINVAGVEVLDGARLENVLAAYTGDEVPQKMQGLISKSSTDRLGPGESGVFFIHFQIEKPEFMPMVLGHRVIISGDFSPEFNHFRGRPSTEIQIGELGGVTNISHVSPIVLGPPLEGNGWIAADGCCTATRHIRAIMPINGQLRVAQRFAIDWELMNDQQRIYTGDPIHVNSYVAYGQKVLAVADATVVRVVDEYPDQVPGKLPSGMTLAEADGNHLVLDLGNGQYAFYAHLKPGSITAHRVKVGDRVCRGQVLGLVGNSGNTTAPHLHFHVMSSPSPLGSNGLPYVIDNFELLGRTPSTAAFDKAEEEGTPIDIQEVKNPGRHSKELPLDLSVVRFPEAQNCVAKGVGPE